MYLKALRNPVTQASMIPLNKILEHLMKVYVNLNPKTIMDKKNELETFHGRIGQKDRDTNRMVHSPELIHSQL